MERSNRKMPGWAIALMVVAILALVACLVLLGFLIAGQSHSDSADVLPTSVTIPTPEDVPGPETDVTLDVTPAPEATRAPDAVIDAPVNDQPPAPDQSVDLGELVFNTRQNAVTVSNDFFYVNLPILPEWVATRTTSDCVRFTYPPAAQAGYGGFFLSIRVYTDDSYQEIPSYYSLLARDGQYRYVAIFPGDVQFDPDDPLQAEEYQQLLSAAEALAEPGSGDFGLLGN